MRLRLVEEEDVGPADEARRQRRELPLPSRELRGGGLQRRRLEPEVQEQGPDLPLQAGPPDGDPSVEQLLLATEDPLHPREVTRQVGVGQLRLDGPEGGVDLGDLGPGLQDRPEGCSAIADNLLGEVGGHRFLAPSEVAAVDGLEAAQDAEEGGLAGPVRPD